MDLIFTRHARSSRNATIDDTISNYGDLTNLGVKQADETVKNSLMPILENAKKGTLLYIAGNSDQQRTNDTATEYGEEFKRICNNRNDILVITKDDLKEINGTFAKISYIQNLIKTNEDKKIVVAIPMQIKQLSYNYNNRWTQNQKKTEYFAKIVDKYNGDHAPCVNDWIQNDAVLNIDGKQILGPKPNDVASQYLIGAKRLNDFAQNIIGSRPLITLAVGHQWDLDAVVVKSAKGIVNYQNFIDVTCGTVINEAEVMRIDDSKVDYRKKVYLK